MSRSTFGILIVVGIMSVGLPSRSFAAIGYSTRFARQVYQNQMKQQAAMQKSMLEAEQKAAVAQQAEEKRQAEEHAKSVRARRAKDATKKEELVARRKKMAEELDGAKAAESTTKTNAK